MKREGGGGWLLWCKAVIGRPRSETVTTQRPGPLPGKVDVPLGVTKLPTKRQCLPSRAVPLSCEPEVKWSGVDPYCVFKLRG